MRIEEFQRLIEEIYGAKDRARGMEGTFLWLVEEVGELSRALRRGDAQARAEEFADVLAWLTTLASMAGVDLESAALEKYGRGCSRCARRPCTCTEPLRSP